ncbi:MAG TPA: DUF1592 domain-containing protein, partial [Polyangiaceae bacterium]|nr:DUF1592 domain-containing protein [Polyangiaceae bacterium]
LLFMVNAMGRRANIRTAYTVPTDEGSTRSVFFAQRSNLLCRVLVATLLSTSLLGCSCNPFDLGDRETNLPNLDGDTGSSGNGNAGVGAGGGSGGSGGGAHAGGAGIAGASFGGSTLTATSDEFGLRRLTNYEYDNTVRDLFGTSLQPSQTFPADATWAGFDNAATEQQVTEAHYERYFLAALDVANDIFGDAALRARVLSCTPAAGDLSCARQIAETLGVRVWRRPLDETELTQSVALFEDAIALGETPEGAVQHMVRGWLSSLQFLYRMELDPQPDAAMLRPLNGYEVASRLSYLLWSSVPDDVLLAAAAQDQISGIGDEAVLLAELERMLADPKSAAFVEHYGGQWLRVNDLGSHLAEPAVFPAWTETLLAAMQREGHNYFNEFLRNDLPLSDFFTHDVNFVDAELAALYGFAPPANDLTRVEEASDVRRGFLGLGAFLTASSRPNRTSPTQRGSRVLDLLCVDVPAPPPTQVDVLQPPDAPPVDTTNIREALAQHLNNAACAACHAVIDPFGLGLENFDGIGAFRTTYSNGDSIDASGMMPDGTQWSDFTGMTEVLAADPRFFECATEKLFIYAHGRRPFPAELPHLERIHDQALSQGASMQALLRRLILSDTFRYRHIPDSSLPPSYL